MRSHWIGALAGACALALAAPATSSAVTYTATATVAPIVTGSYLLTVTNTGPDVPGGFDAAAVGAKNVVADASCSAGIVDAIACGGTFGAGAVVRVCYSGAAATTVQLAFSIYSSIPVTSAPATTCPLAGFTPAAPVTPAPVTPVTPAPVAPAPVTPTTPAAAPVKTKAKAVHSWKRALCVSTYKSWKSRHKHATAKQRRAEQSKLKTQHGCKASALK
jgi:hypothetical protein